VTYFVVTNSFRHILTILTHLHPIFINQSKVSNAVLDNACGAVARMISAKCQNLPLQQILPVLLTALPLKEDYQENETVYGAICGLLSEGNNIAAGFMREILSVLARALQSDKTQDNVKNGILGVLRGIAEKLPTQFSQVVKSLSQEEQQVLMSKV
jgi:hypothetical protein